MPFGPWFEKRYVPAPTALSGRFEMRVRRLIISSTSWRDVLATIEDPVNGPARVEAPFGGEEVFTVPLNLVRPPSPPWIVPTTVGWTMREGVKDVLREGVWQTEYEVEWAYVMFRAALDIPQGIWPPLDPEEAAGFPPGWSWDQPEMAYFVMPQFTSEFTVTETPSSDFVPGPGFDEHKRPGDESVKGAAQSDWRDLPYTQWHRPSQLAARGKALVLNPGDWGDTPSIGVKPETFNVVTFGGDGGLSMFTAPYIWAWPRWDVPPTPSNLEPTKRILSGSYTSRVEMTVHVVLPDDIMEAFVPERRRYWYPGVSGQYRLRQRQTATGADSWPLRQRQNGAHSGSWPLRQRQTGV